MRFDYISRNNWYFLYLELKYDVLQANILGTLKKNGNISQVIWKVRGRERQAYSLSYDFLNRMTAARYDNLNDAGTATNNTNAWNESLTYDIRGNINTLIRTGKFKSPVTATCWTDGQIDNLTYTYNANTNRLQKVADTAPAASKVQGWDNMAGAASGSQFGYDANGNMTSDPYKGMTVAYNFMNLPTKFTFTGNKVIDIIYDGGGRKLRKTVTNNSIVQYTQDYLSGIEYRTNSSATLSLESIYHAEGRVFNTNTGTTSADALRYEYAIRDHLGNTRLMFTDKNADGKIDITTTASTEVLQENHYYPFGMNMSGPWQDDAAARNNQYQYNGKELNEDFGLGWNDYGARWYDAALGRFPSVDPIIEDFPYLTPYNYASNNPVTNIDLWGLQGLNFNAFLGSVLGATDAVIADVTGLDLPNPDLGDTGNKAFETAQQTTHTVMAAAGTIEAAAGVLAMEGGTAVAASIVAAPEGAVVVGVGATLVGHGSFVASNAASNLAKGAKVEMKSGGDKTSGSYTTSHESGKQYHGKGGEKRAQQSGKEKAETYDDP